MDVMGIILVTCLLFLWNLVVIHYVSKCVHNYIKKTRDVPAEYVSRKVVHILSGGVTGLLVPVFYEGYYWVVSLSAFLLAGYIFFRRRWRPMYWFQVRENSYEVHFALAYGGALMFGVVVGDVWVGLIPILFLSFGDSVTGLLRAFTQKSQVKSWDGTAAMFTVCSAIGIWRLGWYGVLLGAIVSLIEKVPEIDDNLTVPIVAAVLIYFERLFTSTMI